MELQHFPAGCIETITHAKAGSILAAYSYRYDLNGNRIEQKETNGGPEETTGYDYDLADRLIEIREPERTIDYQLDPVGNRTDELVADSTGTTISHSTLGYNEREQLTDRSDPVQGLTVSQGFDADGNRTGQTINGQQRTFTYDARDRLITLAQPNAPPEISFDYDSEGLRLRKVSGGTETRYRYDQASLLAETNAIGNTQARYHYGAGQLLSRTHDGSTPTQRHYLNDALGSPIALITQQGAISARTQYDAWGEIQKQQGTSGSTVTPDRNQAIAELPVTDDQPIGFTGYLKDTDTGLYYAQARYYDPTVGRFTSEDPEAGTSMQPPSLHRYLYAYANPTVYTDPGGRCNTPFCAWMYGYSYAKDDSERVGVTRAYLNSNPVLGRTAGFLMEGSKLVTGPEAMLQDAVGALGGAAEARQRIGAQIAGLREYGHKLERAALRGGAPGIVKQVIYDFASGIGEHAAQVKIASERLDYICEGQAAFRLANDASVVYGGVSATRSILVRATQAEGAVAGRILETSRGGSALSVKKPPVNLADVDSDFGPINSLPRSMVDNSVVTEFHAKANPKVMQSVLKKIDIGKTSEDARFRSAFYVTDNPLTASKEVRAHNAEPTVTARFSFDRSRARVLDLTNPKVAELFGYNFMDSYKLTGQLAERAIQMGYDAIKYKSVRGAGDNYAILRLESGAMQPQMIAPSP